MEKTKPNTKSPIVDNTTLDLIIKWADIKPIYDKATSKLIKTIKLDGFRKGKAPVQLAKTHLSPESIIQQVLDEILPKLYLELIKKHGKKPISQPEFQPISLSENNDWQLKVIFAEKQPLLIKNYQKIVKEAKKQAQKKYAEELKNSKNKTPAGKKAQDNKTEEEQTLQLIYQTLVQKIEPKVPELLLKQETRHELQHLVARLEPMKLTLDDYLKKTNQTFEQLSSQTAAFSLGKIQLGMIFDAIADEEKIAVDDKEIAEVLKTLPEYQRTNPNLSSSIEASLLEQKVIKHLLGIK